MGGSMKRTDEGVIRDVMLFRDARGWGVTAILGARSCRHWRLRTEAQARYLAAVLELGPSRLPAGSSGSRRHARQLGREVCQGTAPAARRFFDWPGGPPRPRGAAALGPERGCHFDSLNAALASGLELSASACATASVRDGALPWPDLTAWDGDAHASDGDADSLEAALDAALSELPPDEDEGFALASGDFL